ncbi:MAG: PKD domain-containing protein [Bacteroidales bacterium]|nr:PKD domain-containing protein [Bacteroidales bacterium]
MNRQTTLILLIFLLAIGTCAQPWGRACEASFTYIQDQGDHLIVNFTNTSTGDITDFFWDFGDGSSVHGEDPSHAFPSPGIYTVCLTVSNNDTLNPCLDSTCQEVRVDVLPQYDIGGLLFAGDYPINNPLNTGDTAFAYLYRFEEANLVPVDSIYFDTLGYFWFTGVTEGKYFIKTGLMESSSRFTQFLPSYHGDCLQWTDADTLFVDQNFYNVQIRMVQGKPMPEGTGSIQGILKIEHTNGGTTPLEQGQLVLADAAGIPYFCSFSGSEGAFQFNQIPQGEYKIFSEYTGRFSQTIDLVLDEQTPNADSLELKIYAAVQGVDEMPASDAVTVLLFPNPVLSLLKIQISLKHPEEVELILYDHLGQQIKNTGWRFPAGKFQQEIDLTDLPPAIYLISIQDINSGWRISRKIVKK